jgi:hypothetical protein
MSGPGRHACADDECKIEGGNKKPLMQSAIHPENNGFFVKQRKAEQ